MYRSSNMRAFHSVMASGLVVETSAIGEQVQVAQAVDGAHRAREVFDGGRIGDVAARGPVVEAQVLLHEPHDVVDVERR